VSRSGPDFEALYRRHGPAVFRRARRLLQNEAEAHEVVQDLFLSLFERPRQFQGKSAMTTWLYSATTHACLNRLRNQRNRARLLRELGPPPERDGKLSPDALAVLRDTLGNLPPPLGEVAVYAFFDELTHDEIAQLLGCSARQVGNLIARILAWGREQEVSCSSS
jgi:RNA polymerase sigma-70 factor (ECF subfamily)